MKIATDIVAGALVGCGIGWFIDRHFDTSPWFTLICFGFGMAAAFRSIYRIMTAPDAPEETVAERRKKD